VKIAAALQQGGARAVADSVLDSEAQAGQEGNGSRLMVERHFTRLHSDNLAPSLKKSFPSTTNVICSLSCSC